jgi:hypothetical protein
MTYNVSIAQKGKILIPNYLVPELIKRSESSYSAGRLACTVRLSVKMSMQRYLPVAHAQALVDKYRTNG